MSLHCEVAFFCYVIRYATLGAHERRESKNVVYLDLLSWTESGAQHAWKRAGTVCGVGAKTRRYDESMLRC